MAAEIGIWFMFWTPPATTMSLVPLITASGAGAAARSAMGLVIFAGLIVGTMFTLFVVPMFYTFLAARDLPAEPETPSYGPRAAPAE